MKRVVLSVLSYVLLNGASPVLAQSGQAFYSGTFECSREVYRTDWLVTQGLGGGISATVYYQKKGSERANLIDVTENASGSENTLNDVNGVPRISVSPEDKGLSAQWLKGAPGYECDKLFLVEKTESPNTRFDKLFALLEIEKPTSEQVTETAGLIQSAPIFFTLPELDQQTYIRRFHDLRDSFWKRYSDQVLANVMASPLATSEEREKFSSLLSSALSGQFMQEAGSDWPGRVYQAMSQSIDQYMVLDDASANGLFSGGTVLCERLSGISTSPYNTDFYNVELAAGLPTGYWTRAEAEEALRALRSCDKDNYASKLAQTWPKIEQEQLIVKALLAEQKRLLGLPVSIETFIETQNLSPNDDVVKGTNPGSSIYDRFLGKALDTRRKELVQVALASISLKTQADELKNEPVRDSVKKTCEALRKTSNISTAIRQEIGEVCQNVEDTLAELDCEQAVALSGLDAELLESTIEVYDSPDAKVRDIVCAMNKRDRKNLTITFENSGFLLWKKQHLKLHRTRNDSDSQVLDFILEPSTNSATWALVAADEQTKAEMDMPREPGVEKLTACMMGAPSCPF